MKMCVMALAGFAVMAFIAFVLFSCAPRVVTVPEYHREYVNSTDTFLRVDSFVSNTSTIIREANEGDSLMLAEYGIRLKENERLLLFLHRVMEQAVSDRQENHTDTFIKTDSIRVPYPVEKKLTKWQQAKIDLGGWMVCIIIASVVALCFWIFRRKVI